MWNLVRASLEQDTPLRRGIGVKFAAGARSLNTALLERALSHQPLEAFLDQLLDRFSLRLGERLLQRLAQRLPHGRRVAVRATNRLRDYAIHQAKCLQPVGRDAQRLRRVA